MHYVKIYSGIVESSVADLDVSARWLWIVLLTKADRYGNVYGTPSALARTANLSYEQTVLALQDLSSPDPRSTTPDEDGRRIIEGPTNTWHIVNYLKYRAMKDPERDKDTARERMRRFREKQAENVTRVTPDVTECYDKVAVDLRTSKEVRGDKSPKPHKQATKTPPDPDVKILIDCFVAGFVERCGVKPTMDYGRAGKVAKELLSCGNDRRLVFLVAYWWGKAPLKRQVDAGFSAFQFLPQHFDDMLRSLREERINLDLDSPKLPIARFFSDSPAGQTPTSPVAAVSGDSR